MDPVRFDGLTRVLSTVGDRREVMALVAALPLGGALATLSEDEAAAERPRNRLQRRSGQRNRKQRSKKSNQKQNGRGPGANQCGATGSVCTQDGDCCTNNCFGFECAELVTSCGQGSSATRCQPPARGCGGNQCCHGSLACGDTCCQSAANQCNPQNACCVPNCAGRQCGADGCGNGKTCGSCPTGQTCDATSGTCQGGVTCSAENCPDGCCDTAGKCQPGNTVQACGIGGAACAPCSGSTPTCKTGQCVARDNGFLCTCNNGVAVANCNAATCNPDDARAVCDTLCADHGGFGAGGSSAQCASNSCVA